MSKKKSFLLRLPPDLMDHLQRWSNDELRSLNGQIEYILRESLRSQRGIKEIEKSQVSKED